MLTIASLVPPPADMTSCLFRLKIRPFLIHRLPRCIAPSSACSGMKHSRLHLNRRGAKEQAPRSRRRRPVAEDHLLGSNRHAGGGAARSKRSPPPPSPDGRGNALRPLPVSPKNCADAALQKQGMPRRPCRSLAPSVDRPERVDALGGEPGRHAAPRTMSTGFKRDAVRAVMKAATIAAAGAKAAPAR